MATLNGIAQHAQEHQALLTQIGELDYAPSALEQASERLKTIQAELPPRKAKLAEVQKATKKEYDEWQQVLNSRFKRASLKIKGKDHLESRVEKEEREWMEAMREETNEKNAIAAIEAEIEELNIMVKDLENLSKKHKQLQKRLDDIYARVFDGPSTAFPEEDHAETEVYALEKEYRDNQTKVNQTAQVINLLSKADGAMKLSMKHLRLVLGSLQEPLLFRGSFAEHMERDDVQRAGMQAAQVARLYSQACSVDPSLPRQLPLPDLNGLAQTYYADRFYLSAYQQVDQLNVRVLAASKQLLAAADQLRRAVRTAQSREQDLDVESRTLHLRLRRARIQLDSTRRAIMIDVGNNAGAMVAEPESMESSSAGAERQPSNNPYASYLASRASTLDAAPSAEEAPPPAYAPRTNLYQGLLL